MKKKNIHGKTIKCNLTSVPLHCSSTFSDHFKNIPHSSATNNNLKYKIGFGGGLLPLYAINSISDNSFSKNMLSFQLKKQWDIANVVPVQCVRLMSKKNWHELLNLEGKYIPRDWSPVHNKLILGCLQTEINRELRRKAVNWMNEACSLFNWANQTFFTAVHAWDMYITSVSHVVPLSDLGILSTACLYYGAQLIESAADENIKTLDEFMELCPKVGSTDAIREIQAHLVDTLQGVSLVSRTPTDFLLLYLGEMQIAPSPCPQLYLSLMDQNLLVVLWDLCISVCFVVYTNGLILDGLPGSRWVAGVMLRVIEFSCPNVFNDTNIRDTLCEKVFHVSSRDFDQFQSLAIDPMLKFVWDMVIENSTTNQHPHHSHHNQDHFNNSLFKTQSTNSWSVIRHTKPFSFFDWKITIPSTKIVQDVAERLRKTFSTIDYNDWSTQLHYNNSTKPLFVNNDFEDNQSYVCMDNMPVKYGNNLFHNEDPVYSILLDRSGDTYNTEKNLLQQQNSYFDRNTLFQGSIPKSQVDNIPLSYYNLPLKK